MPRDPVTITSTGFGALLKRLGVVPFPSDGFELLRTVIPVSIVDTDIVLPAVSSSPLIDAGNVNSAGEQTAPVVNTRLANTGAQAAGSYNATFVMSAGEVTNFRVRRRNAADTADIWSIRLFTGNTQSFNFALRVALAVNEFLVIENAIAGGVGIVYQATIFLSAG